MKQQITNSWEVLNIRLLWAEIFLKAHFIVNPDRNQYCLFYGIDSSDFQMSPQSRKIR